MVKYLFSCINNHSFDMWFKSISYYEEEVKGAKEIICPLCGSLEVKKQISSPGLVGVTSKRGDKEPAASKTSNLLTLSLSKEKLVNESPHLTDVELTAKALQKLQTYITNNFKYVGKDFKSVALKMQKQQLTKEHIYGEATLNEAIELKEAGVDVLMLPFDPEASKKLN